MSRLLQHFGLCNNQFFIEQNDLLLLKACVRHTLPLLTPPSTMGASHMHMIQTIGNPIVIPRPIRRPMVGEHGRSEGRKSRRPLPVSSIYALKNAPSIGTRLTKSISREISITFCFKSKFRRQVFSGFKHCSITYYIWIVSFKLYRNSVLTADDPTTRASSQQSNAFLITRRHDCCSGESVTVDYMCTLKTPFRGSVLMQCASLEQPQILLHSCEFVIKCVAK